MSYSESISYVKNFLSNGGRYRRYDVMLAKKFGNVAYAIIFADMLDCYLDFMEKRQLKSHIRHGDNLMYYTIKHACDRTAVKRCQFETAIDKFMDLGLLSTITKIDREGRTYYKFDIEAVAEYIRTSVDQPMLKSTSRNAEINKPHCRNQQPMKTIKNLTKEPNDIDGQAPSPFQKNQDFVFDPRFYKLKDGKPLTTRAQQAYVKMMASPAGRLKLLGAISCYEQKIAAGEKPRKGHEVFLQWIINGDMAQKMQYSLQNEIYANFAKQEYGLTDIEMLKTVIHLKMHGQTESISKDLNPEQFSQIIDNYITKTKTRS